MIDWQKTAKAVIDQVDQILPADADLRTRQKALNGAWPGAFSVTNWGKKVRAKYTRAYLEKHGLPPRHPKHISEHLSPLELLIRKTREIQD